MSSDRRPEPAPALSLDVTGPREDGGPPFDGGGTPYDTIGGDARVRDLVDRFYGHMDADPAFAHVRRLHPDDLATSREKLHLFLTGWLGGPPLYVERHGHPRLRARHMPFAIGTTERDEWLACMGRALDDLAVGGALRAFLDARFAHVANFLRNTGG